MARHPTSGEPILAGIGRYGSYVQHGKTYANLGRDDDVLEIGANRAIDLIVAKESGAGGSRFGAGAGRELGEHPEGGKVSVKSGRFGSYVNHGKINATLPKGTDPASLTLEEAIELIKAKAAGGGVIGRLVGEHPDGGPVTVRDGRFGAYVNWGKVNATLPKGSKPDSVTLAQALDLLAEREGKPVARPRKPGKAPVKSATAESAKVQGETRRPETASSEEGRRVQAEIRRPQARIVWTADPGLDSGPWRAVSGAALVHLSFMRHRPGRRTAAPCRLCAGPSHDSERVERTRALQGGARAL